MSFPDPSSDFGRGGGLPIAVGHAKMSRTEARPPLRGVCMSLQQIRRREVIAAIAGAAIRPIAAQAQGRLTTRSLIEARTVYGCITVFCAGERVGGRLRRATTIVKCVRQVRLAFSVQSSEEDSPARSASWFQPRYWLALTKSSNNDVFLPQRRMSAFGRSGHAGA